MKELGRTYREIGLFLSILSTGSVRRGAIRRAIAYADSFPPPGMLSGLSNVEFEGWGSWEAARNLAAQVMTNEPVREAMRLVGGGAYALVREAENLVYLNYN